MAEDAERMGYSCKRQIFDDGRSAYRGQHIEKGQLGELLAEIDAGDLVGWVFQCENIDRLTRQGHEAALELVRRITQAGVAIHTCDGDYIEAYKPVSMEQVIVLVVKADLANKEAAKRSDRASASWSIRQAKAKTGSALPGAGPSWLKRRGDTYEVVPEFAAQARLIWEISDETGHGAHTIARRLNEQRVPMFGTGKPWYSSRVDLILSGMEVIGYHQPRRNVAGKWLPYGEPIKVYPEIISHELYHRVRRAAAARLATHGGGKSARIANLLSGLCRCASCGASMRLAGSSNGGYLMCGGRDRGVCANSTAFRYRAFEQTVIDEFLHLAIDDDAFSNKSEVARLNSLIAERETAHTVKLEEARDHLRRASRSPLSEDLGLAAEAEANEIAANLRALKLQREAAKGRASAAEHLARVKDMRERLSTDLDLRRKVLQAFNTVIERISFGSDGVAQLRLVGGIIEVMIDREGNVVQGEAIMTLKEDELSSFGDKKIVDLARLVAQRFARSFDRGEANWSVVSTGT
jgi:hypothetical protein